MNMLTSFGLRRARSRKHAGRFQDLVGAPQLKHLFAQLLDLLALLRGGQIRPQATVSLGLAHLLAQRLVVDPEIGRDVTDRATGLDRQPHTALDQLIGILPWSWHLRRFS
jgi:hypothetical protein